MKSVFLLWHTHELPDGEEDSKFIGVYESKDAAEHAKGRVRCLPGFAEHPDGFEISAYEIGRDHWTEGFLTVIESEDKNA
jgi:hypothetical protein